MKRYQKLIQAKANEIGYTPLAREIGVPSTSVHEWATQPYKTPHYKSLVNIAAYFNVPVPTLLMEVGDVRNHDDDIIEALYLLTEDQKGRVVDFIKDLAGSCP